MNNTDKYIENINAHILPFIDYGELTRSYMTDMEYVKGVLNRLHEAMADSYGGETLGEESGDEDGFVLVPGAVQNRNSGEICLALLTLDLQSSGEHWGTDFLCEYGVVSQSPAISPDLKPREAALRKRHSEAMNKSLIPYDYVYTARIPGDIHIDKSRLPDGLKDIMDDFRNHRAELLYEEEAENGDAPEPGDDD